jgi:hypothetical protein
VDAVSRCDRTQFRFVASHQNGIGYGNLASRQFNAALVSDGQNRTHQVLVHAHSPGDAVHDDADFSLGHSYFLADADLQHL